MISESSIAGSQIIVALRSAVAAEEPWSQPSSSDALDGAEADSRTVGPEPFEESSSNP